MEVAKLLAHMLVTNLSGVEYRRLTKINRCATLQKSGQHNLASKKIQVKFGRDTVFVIMFYVNSKPNRQWFCDFMRYVAEGRTRIRLCFSHFLNVLLNFHM
jgi:hypothetical protein